MKPETLKRLNIEIKTVSDFSLDQFFIAVLDEIRRRNPKYNRLPRSPEGPWKKDCEPIRG